MILVPLCEMWEGEIRQGLILVNTFQYQRYFNNLSLQKQDHVLLKRKYRWIVSLQSDITIQVLVLVN